MEEGIKDARTTQRLSDDNLPSKDLLSQDEATTSNDAESSKPSPDIVQAALDRLNIPASQVVMLGDTAYDIESANQAGVDVIALRCGGFDDSQLENAIAIYNDPAELLTEFDSSPLAIPAITTA
ncbi:MULTISPECIES: HAD family hydrolase [unclassified Tolypothrix]|uniref:HAD family hydrolase n=1 Tax=unclassified Tolypothrix TaxID=2649714 RepID=UPI0009D9C032|nr:MULTISPECIES: HAD-IA family hydrolase [unclassified Tolypothrix]MBE9085076.1 HAD family hydrolase [Tolypothrix sp. LEGE 11397]UYD29361.1 HAD family hydrolase [Tolypothrix sp. PCC 7712]UYD34732.1 HAD family hydrolase [Tolypothrix sp. PCC 7601]BAY88692.1 hypothetical protein NIES3275_06700 [Microchaete diplosiphon NIES-3275]